MQTPIEITYRHMEPSPPLEEKVAQRVRRVEDLCGRLVSFRAAIDAPHQHHQKGNQYAVRLEAHHPSTVFIVDRRPGDDFAHRDVHVALRDAFDALERQIKRWKEMHSGRPEVQIQPLQGRIAELRPDRDHGHVALTDGRLVYFHRNSVLGGGFDRLGVGDAVAVVLDERDSAKGPHASAVRPISGQRFLDDAKTSR